MPTSRAGPRSTVPGSRLWTAPDAEAVGASAAPALKAVRNSVLVTLLDHACVVLAVVPGDDRALLPLRQLIDALAHATVR
jgi:hypothetical protein